MEKKSLSLYLWLFKVNFFISAFTFGGGYVVIPMIRKYFVTEKHLFSEDELMDMAAIAQSSPGAIAINLAVLAGYRTAGFSGAVVSGISSVTPPFLILSVISSCYQVFRDLPIVAAVLKGMEAAVGALIVDIVADMGAAVLKEKKPFFACLMPAAFAGSFLFGINVMVLLLLCTGACLVYYYAANRSRGLKPAAAKADRPFKRPVPAPVRAEHSDYHPSNNSVSGMSVSDGHSRRARKDRKGGSL